MNLNRAIRLVFRHPMNLFGGLVCCLLVAVMWGGNITALYPIFEVTFQGRSLHDWIDEEIETISATQSALAEKIAALEKKAGAGAEPAEAAELATLRDRLQAEQAAAARARWLQPLIHRFLPAAPFQTVVVIVVFIIVATAAKDVCIIANNLITARLIHNVKFDLQRQFYQHVLRLDHKTFGQLGPSHLMSRFSGDVGGTVGGISSIFGKGMREPLKMLACLLPAAWICWRLLIFSLLLAPLSLLLIRMLGKAIRREGNTALDEDVQANRVVFEAFTSLKEIQAFCREQWELERYCTAAQRCIRRAMRIVLLNSLSKPATELMGITAVGLALIGGAHLVLNQETHLLGIRMCDRPISLPSLLVFYGLLIGMSDPVRKLSGLFAEVQLGAAAADRVYAILDQQPLVHGPADPVVFPSKFRQLVLEGVTFRYDATKPVLRDVSLQIERGETVAIVGPNGCGKSTLLHLLPRFYDPEKGRVRLDHIDLRTLRLSDLRSRLAIVAQSAMLFDDTVMNNLRYGSPGACDEEVYVAARKARAHDFIDSELPDGYATQVGQNGSRLSGGQRQRLALARAMLCDPEILILDEATSQVDIHSERLIHEALAEFSKNRTTLAVTHRLSTLEIADRIVVMNEGRILDVGPHRALMERCEFYRQLRTAPANKAA